MLRKRLLVRRTLFFVNTRKSTLEHSMNFLEVTMNKIDELKNDGWEVIENFGATCVVMAYENNRMLVDKFTGEIIIKY